MIAKQIELTRHTRFEPAFDKRNDPKGNFGIHGVNLRMWIKGPKGVVQFLLFTNWFLPQNRRPSMERVEAFLVQPQPADLGYHSYTARYGEQEPMAGGGCEFLDNAPCYYDGSGLQAEGVFDALCAEGDAGVWKILEARYMDLFEKEEVMQ